MLVKNVPSELYIYFFYTELQRRDDSIVCLAHVCSCLSKYNKLIHKQKLSMCNVAYHFKVNCIVNEFFKRFLYIFQKKLFLNCISEIFGQIQFSS